MPIAGKTLQHKKLVWNFYQDLNNAAKSDRSSVIRNYVHTNVKWHGPHPINHLEGAEALISGFWHPLSLSFSNLHRETHILMAGQFAGKDWASAIGYLSGAFTGDWLGISATGRETHIRFGEFLALNNDGKIAEIYTLLDILDVLRQAGNRPLPPDRGESGLVPPPLAGDGVMLEPKPDHEGVQSIDLAMRMGRALGADYDGVDLDSMQLERFWDPEKMLWYGPAGVGTARTLRGFQEVMQGPWKRAFPDSATNIEHLVELGEGPYAAYAGFPGMVVTHRSEYLGYPATGKKVEVRVMDWWRREGNLLVENWVLIDLPHLFLQLGVDLLTAVKPESIRPTRGTN